LFAALALGAIGLYAAEPLQSIHVSDNGRYFVKAMARRFSGKRTPRGAFFNHATPPMWMPTLMIAIAKVSTSFQGVIALWDHTRHTNCDGELPLSTTIPARSTRRIQEC